MIAKAAALFLTCFVALSANAQTGFTYWPSNEGDWITYKVYLNTIIDMDPGTGLLQPHDYIYQGNVTLTWRGIQNPWSVGPYTLFAYVVDANGPVDDVPSDLANTLVDSIATVDGPLYLGECGNFTHTETYPPEAKLTQYPVVGEMHQAVSKGIQHQAVWDFAWTYRTVAHLANWQGWNDVVITTLEEKATLSSAPYSYYMYYFANGIGLVGQCYRNNGLNNPGYTWVAIVHGNQP